MLWESLQELSNTENDSKAENSHVDVDDASSVVIVVVGAGVGATVLLTTILTLESLLVVAGALGLTLEDAIVAGLVEELTEGLDVSG
jgi:RsiW-degrading membrane proteinase PrsW (M82 family)